MARRSLPLVLDRIIRAAQGLMSVGRSERRDALRMFDSGDVLLVRQSGNHVAAANLLNRSHGGLCVRHREALEPNERVLVLTPELSQPARVVWCHSTTSGYEIGLAYQTERPEKRADTF